MSLQSSSHDLIRDQIDSLDRFCLPSRERSERGQGLDPSRDGIALVVAISLPERLPTLVRNLRQVADESVQPGAPFRIDSVAIVDFGLPAFEMGQLTEFLRELERTGQIRTFCVARTEPHSAARSFNVGVQQLRESGPLPAYIVKVDDDSRYAPGALARTLAEAYERGLDIVAPATVRSDATLHDDRAFGHLCESFRLPGNFVSAPDYTRPRGKVDLSRLMLGYNTIFAHWPTPVTPNENGMVLSNALVDDLMRSGGKVFSEVRGGSEGLRLFLALSQSPYADRIGVVKSPIFDRSFGDPTQPISWGRSDAQLYETVRELGLLPPGLTAGGISNEGVLYHLYVPGAKPAVVKCVERLQVIRDVLHDPERDGLYHGLPRAVQEILPLMRREADGMLDLLRTSWKRGQIDIIGATRPDDSNFRYAPGYHWGSVLHFAGVVMYCREKELPIMVFPT